MGHIITLNSHIIGQPYKQSPNLNLVVGTKG